MRNPIIRPAILLSAAILTLAACDSTLFNGCLCC